MNKDNIKEYIVCLNGGSGVIFQPKDELYSYILTAKHVLDDISDYDSKVSIDRFDPDRGEFISLMNLELTENVNYFPDKIKDIAILKIQRLTGANKLVRIDDFDSLNSEIALFGFPVTRREEAKFSNRIREDLNLTLSIEKSEGKREAVLDDNSTWDELVGQSGGALFSLQGDYLGLLGIQNKVPTLKETKGRIEFSPLHNFNEIIIGSKGELEELIPPYLKSFSFLKDDVFTFPSDLYSEKIINKISEAFEVKTKEIIKCDFTPNCIKEYLDVTELLIYNQKEDELNEKEIWLHWLELLTILNIVKGKKHMKSDFDKIFSQVRILHSNTNKDFWVENIDDVAKTNFDKLSINGVVVVSSKQKPLKDNYILNTTAIPERIDSIRTNFNAEDMPYGKENSNIASGSSFPFDNFEFVHIEYFKTKLIVDDYPEFSELLNKQILELLKNKYEQIFK